MPSYGIINSQSPSNAAWASFIDTHTTAYNTMQSAWSLLNPGDPVGGMQTAFDIYQGVISAAFTSLSSTFGGAFDGANNFFSDAFDSFQNILGGAGTVSDGLAAMGGTADAPTGVAGADMALGLGSGQTAADNRNGKADLPGSQGVLYPLGRGAPLEFAEVNYVETGLGIKPGMASVTIQNVVSHDEAAGLYVLQDGSVLSDKTLKEWSRWGIKWRGTQIFNGALMGRRDDIGNQAVHLTFVDDRTLLEKIPIRGALVYDRVAGAVKYVTGYYAHTNPNGYRNCTQVTIPGIAGLCYVFTEMAEQATLGLSAYNRIGDEGTVRAGDAIFWTPFRWLTYLRIVALVTLDLIPADTFQGTIPKLNTDKLDWSYFGFSDSASLITHKMPDIDFKGKSIMYGVIKGLEQTGEFDLAVQFRKTGQSAVSFVALTAENNHNSNNTLDLQTSGRAIDGRSIYDGTLDSDASEFASVSVTEGKRVAVESQFGYVEFVDNTGSITDGSSTLFPAWDFADEYPYFSILWRAQDALGNALQYSDGTNIQPGAEVLTSIARQAYPKVFRALEIRSANIANIMAGVDNKYLTFDYIFGHRSMLNDQLQPYFERDTAGKVARGRLRLPVRIQVSDLKASDAAGTYQEVPFNNGLRFEDGLIWFDGLTDDINSTYNIYSGQLKANGTSQDPSATTADYYPKLRRILINMAVELDVRTFGSADINTYNPNLARQNIDGGVLPNTNTGKDILVDYMLNPEGFREEHQVNSRPCTANAFQVANADGTAAINLTLPVNKILHEDDDELDRAAKRRLRRAGKLGKRFQFSLPGIRPDLYAGMFITDIVLRPDGSRYSLNAPLMRVRYDFGKQHTVVAGQEVIGEIVGE